MGRLDFYPLFYGVLSSAEAGLWLSVGKWCVQRSTGRVFASKVVLPVSVFVGVCNFAHSSKIRKQKDVVDDFVFLG